jgi:hypothetical protein
LLHDQCGEDRLWAHLEVEELWQEISALAEKLGATRPRCSLAQLRRADEGVAEAAYLRPSGQSGAS